jgi:hypothetical protein
MGSEAIEQRLVGRCSRASELDCWRRVSQDVRAVVVVGAETAAVAATVAVVAAAATVTAVATVAVAAAAVATAAVGEAATPRSR